jgi:hypothetical protein
MKKLFFSFALMALANLTFACTTQTASSKESVVKSNAAVVANNSSNDEVFPCTVCISDGTVTICISGNCRIIIVIE